jgi:hypothetical protein
MWKDPIVEEVRQIRDENAARFGYDLTAIFIDMKERDEEDRDRLVSRSPKAPKTQGLCAPSGSSRNSGRRAAGLMAGRVPSRKRCSPTTVAHPWTASVSVRLR